MGSSSPQGKWVKPCSHAFLDSLDLLQVSRIEFDQFLRNGNGLYRPAALKESKALQKGLEECPATHDNSECCMHVSYFSSREDEEEYLLLSGRSLEKGDEVSVSGLLRERKEDSVAGGSNICGCSLGPLGAETVGRSEEKKALLKQLQNGYLIERGTLRERERLCEIMSIVSEKRVRNSAGQGRPNILGLILRHPHQSLWEQIQDRKELGDPFRQSEMWTILIDCLEALAQYHRLGESVLHQLNLTPQNVYVGKNGHIYISDLGILYHQLMGTEFHHFPNPHIFSQICHKLGLLLETLFEVNAGMGAARTPCTEELAEHVQLLKNLREGQEIGNLLRIVEGRSFDLLRQYLLEQYRRTQVEKKTASAARGNHISPQLKPTPQQRQKNTQIKVAVNEFMLDSHGTAGQSSFPSALGLLVSSSQNTLLRNKSLDTISSVTSKSLTSNSSLEFLREIVTNIPQEKPVHPLPQTENCPILTATMVRLETDGPDGLGQCGMVKPVGKPLKVRNNFLDDKNNRQDQNSVKIISQKTHHKRTLSERNREFLQNLIKREGQKMIIEVSESEFELESGTSTVYLPEKQVRSSRAVPMPDDPI